MSKKKNDSDIHGCQNYATVSTAASVAAHVPQPNTVYEMRAKILIKKLKKSIEVNTWYTTHQPIIHHSAYPLIVRISVVMFLLLEYVELSWDTCVATLATVLTVA